MGRYLRNEGFRSMIKGIYVDKTEMIAFINSTLGTNNKQACVSRPRRFGKSYAAKMLYAYYDDGCDSRALFEGLAISRDASFETYPNKYHVIYPDITLFISLSHGAIKKVVKNMEASVIEELQEAFPEVSKSDTLAGMLLNITQTNEKKFIMLIDEWDVLFRETKMEPNLLYQVFENIPCRPPGRLIKYIGFAELEVRSLCEQYDMDFEKMKYWYVGYSFSRLKSVYNPNSVMEAINLDEFGSYWTRTDL